MKEQNKAPEKIQPSDEEIANLSDAEFKTLIIRMLMEMVEYGCKIEEKEKAVQSGIKKIREPTVKGRKLDSNQQFGAEGRSKHSPRTQ